MILTDYFRSTPDLTWEIGRQCGIRHGTIRLPETPDFDLTDKSHWMTVYKRFTDYGIRPVVMEPMPNCVHDHIKTGDSMRDESIDRVIRMLPIMEALDIRTICFNFMAHIGWLRTCQTIPERGGALVTGFRQQDFRPTDKAITTEELWENYTYFIRAVVPEAEKHGIRLALHPDDPPLEHLGSVSRILVSAENIRRAINGILPSPCLGLTMCQATFYMMGEDLFQIIPEFREQIFFIHFRNAVGNKYDFRETFHDNGALDMPALMELYHRCGIHVPIRVDHVPTLTFEQSRQAGYDALGRLYAIGYLKGILETVERVDRAPGVS